MTELQYWLEQETDIPLSDRQKIAYISECVADLKDVPLLDKIAALSDLLKAYHFTQEQIEDMANGQAPGIRISVPVNVCVKRYYRVYVDVSENADDDSVIKAKAIDDIVKCQDSVLERDEDLDIEEQDIEICCIDREGTQFFV